MKRTVIGLAALAFTAVLMADAAEVATREDGQKRETRAPTSSNLVDSALPQLAPNLKVGPEVPMARETNAAATPVSKKAPLAAQPRNTLWMILAVVALLLGRPLLKRLRSDRSPP
jgi:hypothetical protein